MRKPNRRSTAFIPKISFKTALKSVVPACAIAATAVAACDSGSVVALAVVGFDAGQDAGRDAQPDSPIIALAVVGFDAAADAQSDAPTIIALAVVGFDAALDADADSPTDAAGEGG
jgi:hypothetical protein